MLGDDVAARRDWWFDDDDAGLRAEEDPTSRIYLVSCFESMFQMSLSLSVAVIVVQID